MEHLRRLGEGINDYVTVEAANINREKLDYNSAHREASHAS